MQLERTLLTKSISQLESKLVEKTQLLEELESELGVREQNLRVLKEENSKKLKLAQAAAQQSQKTSHKKEQLEGITEGDEDEEEDERQDAVPPKTAAVELPVSLPDSLVSSLSEKVFKDEVLPFLDSFLGSYDDAQVMIGKLGAAVEAMKPAEVAPAQRRAVATVPTAAGKQPVSRAFAPPGRVVPLRPSTSPSLAAVRQEGPGSK
mmetsp:Transcript_29133/g.69957  ORF Transcript_29133/g.69957 Transcript_29133/m.69957 type:complete len:206 (-) Transcript_29133:104-721(-)